MYAQAIRTPPVYRHRRANNQAHLNMFKGCAFSNEPCDCIKSLKLGESLGYDVKLTYERRPVEEIAR